MLSAHLFRAVSAPRFCLLLNLRKLPILAPAAPSRDAAWPLPLPESSPDLLCAFVAVSPCRSSTYFLPLSFLVTHTRVLMCYSPDSWFTNLDSLCLVASARRIIL
eukprot:6192795-Pleurochrysis_carterae.AAC.3